MTELLGRPRRNDPLAALTGRVRDVLALVAEGLSNRAIATHLYVVERTVEAHVTAIFMKLGLTDSPDSTDVFFRSFLPPAPGRGGGLWRGVGGENRGEGAEKPVALLWGAPSPPGRGGEPLGGGRPHPPPAPGLGPGGGVGGGIREFGRHMGKASAAGVWPWSGCIDALGSGCGSPRKQPCRSQGRPIGCYERLAAFDGPEQSRTVEQPLDVKTVSA